MRQSKATRGRTQPTLKLVKNAIRRHQANSDSTPTVGVHASACQAWRHRETEAIQNELSPEGVKWSSPARQGRVSHQPNPPAPKVRHLHPPVFRPQLPYFATSYTCAA